jgi:quercetin dioxygenase-like cupin family protein
VRRWNLREIDTPAGRRSPVVLHSGEEARAVLVALEPGEELGVHQVKENAFVTPVEGTLRIETGGDAFDVGVGELVAFEPDERHSISSVAGARLLMFLAPWPGEGHYRGEEQELSSA